MTNDTEQQMTPDRLKAASAMVLDLAAIMLPEAAGTVKIDLSDATGLRVTIRRVAKRSRKA